MVRTFYKGDSLTILTRPNGMDYLRAGDCSVEEPLILMPSDRDVDAEIAFFDVTDECDVVLDERQYIISENDLVFPHIVGGRPSNIVRR